MILSQQQLDEIRSAITQAEQNTSGEIRVHIEKSCRGNVLDRAAFIFKTLKMDQTSDKNGVLFYLAVKDHKFAILGDSGINNIVEPNFWDDIKNKMQDYFIKAQFKDGLVEGVLMAGKALSDYFPYTSTDKNELSDEISIE